MFLLEKAREGEVGIISRWLESWGQGEYGKCNKRGDENMAKISRRGWQKSKWQAQFVTSMHADEVVQYENFYDMFKIHVNIGWYTNPYFKQTKTTKENHLSSTLKYVEVKFCYLPVHIMCKIVSKK